MSSERRKVRYVGTNPTDMEKEEGGEQREEGKKGVHTGCGAQQKVAGVNHTGPGGNHLSDVELSRRWQV